MSLLRSLLTRIRVLREEEPALEPVSDELLDRRRPAYRCVGCGEWDERLVYMSNGSDYCLECAKIVRQLYRHRPAGRRPKDITALH